MFSRHISLTMFSFFKRKRPELPVPEWAAFFNQAEYNKFIAHIENYFKGKSAEFDYDDGVIIVENESQEKTNHGMVNIAQQCKQTPAGEWKRLITSHFDSFKTIDRFNREFDKQAHDFSNVQQYLGARLYSQGYINNFDDDIVITRSVMDGIIAMLVFDFPHSVTNVKPEQSILWNKSEDELFEIGFANIRANYQNEISRERIENFDLLIVSGDHFFVPNVVFEMDSNPELLGTYGSLVAIPHRHAVLIYPIESLQVIEVVNKTIPLAQYMYEQGPGSISDQLYWYYNDEFHHLPYKLDDTTLQFSPPEKFVDMLNELK